LVASQWTPSGWFARGYSGDKQVGVGVITGDLQPWAILAGALARDQAPVLVHNIRRFLTGVGAPSGRSPIGSVIGPSRDDPDVRETLVLPLPGSRSAFYIGGAWYAANAILTLALASQRHDATEAGVDAWDEFLHNTLSAHAEAYPDAWNGVISVDDVCADYFGPQPSTCGVPGFPFRFAGQITHQPAWEIYDAIHLMGLQPTPDGYRVDPVIPLEAASLDLANAGVRFGPARIEGYLRPVAPGDLRLQVRVPDVGSDTNITVDGARVAGNFRDGWASFVVSVPRAGELHRWSVRRVFKPNPAKRDTSEGSHDR
jgi:hypothetical protein